jgi:hypothetical protein
MSRETSDIHPTDGADEVISAYLDGEATPEEVARVESDPRLQARLEVLRAAATAGAAAPAPSREADRERIIAAALDAAGPSPRRAEVVDLDEARRRRARRLAPLLTAAAAILVVLFAIPLLAGLGDDDGDNQAATGVSEPPPEISDEAGGAAAATTAAPGVAAPTASAAFPQDLGAFADEAALVDVVDELASTAEGLAAAESATTTAAADAGSGRFDCAAAIAQANTALGPLRLTAVATVAGQPVWVFVYGDPPSQILVIATDPGCEPTGPPIALG